MEVLLAVVLALAASGWAAYLSWTAGRLDRLHSRVDAAAAALDAHLARRAELAAALAAADGVPAEPAGRLAAVAAAARAHRGLGAGRAQAESSLTRALREVVAASDPYADPYADPRAGGLGDTLVDPRAGGLGDALADAVDKAVYARRFHNDAVRDTLAVRRRRVPRLFRLSGRAPLPAYFDVDDDPTAGRRDSGAWGGRPVRRVAP